MDCINIFLTRILNTDFSLNERKEEMKRICLYINRNSLLWSDLYGLQYSALDNLLIPEIFDLIDNYYVEKIVG